MGGRLGMQGVLGLWIPGHWIPQLAYMKGPPPTIEVRHQFLGLFSPLGLYRLTGSFVAKVTSLVSFLVKGPQTFP